MTRPLLAPMVAAMFAVSSGPALTQATHVEPSRVTVSANNGVYHVTAGFQVGQQQSTVLAVLTDYEQIPRFMPEVKTSIIRERFPGGVLVEQEAVSRMMMFSKRVHLLLEVRVENDIIRFRDICEESFAQYAGTWQVSQLAGQTNIAYELFAKPSFDVPGFMVSRMLKKDAKQMIERLRGEISARGYLFANGEANQPAR